MAKKIQKNKIKFLLALFALCGIFAGIFVHADLPLLPDTFKGSVKIDSSDAPVGTNIFVLLENNLASTYTLTTTGQYIIDVVNGSSGNSIKFNLSGQIAGESTRKGGKILNLDLSVFNDRDKDGVPDGNDKLIGAKENISTNYNNLDVFIDNDNNLPATASSVKQVIIKSGADIILEFPFDFDVNTLNLFNIETKKETGTANLGSFFVRGITLTSSQRKTAYVNKLNNTSEYVCIKDAEISSITEISSKCNSTNESLIRCNGNAQNDYTCTAEGSRYKISGLKNSGISEYTCAENWQCSGWDTCSSGMQTRTCTDLNSCGTAISKPAETQSCESPSSGTANSGGNGGGGSGGGGTIVPTTTTTTQQIRETAQTNPEKVLKVPEQKSPIIESVPDKDEKGVSSANTQTSQQGFFSGIWDSITGVFKGGNQITGQVVAVEQGNGNLSWTIAIIAGIAVGIIVIGLILTKIPSKQSREK